jgi:hypothetical protein
MTQKIIDFNEFVRLVNASGHHGFKDDNKYGMNQLRIGLSISGAAGGIFVLKDVEINVQYQLLILSWPGVERPFKIPCPGSNDVTSDGHTLTFKIGNSRIHLSKG